MAVSKTTKEKPLPPTTRKDTPYFYGESRLKGLHPNLVRFCVRLGVDWAVVMKMYQETYQEDRHLTILEGQRSTDDQVRYLLAKPPTTSILFSKHLAEPKAMAVDIGILKVGFPSGLALESSFDQADLDNFMGSCKRCDIDGEFRFGADWNNPDVPHVEVKGAHKPTVKLYNRFKVSINKLVPPEEQVAYYEKLDTEYNDKAGTQ